MDKEDPQSGSSDLMLCAFALADCTVEIEAPLAKYLRAVHRTALELAVPNLFGFEIGGFWLTPAQLSQLRRLPECYPANEIEMVKRAVETYLLAQTEGLYRNSFISAEVFTNVNLFAITGHKLQSPK